LYPVTYTVKGYDVATEEEFEYTETTFEKAKYIYDEYAKFDDVMNLVICENTHYSSGSVSRVIYPAAKEE